MARNTHLRNLSLSASKKVFRGTSLHHIFLNIAGEGSLHAIECGFEQDVLCRSG